MRDEEILRLFRERDERAIEEARQAYGAYCGKIAMGILRDARDCEECLNDVWLSAWQALAQTQPEQLKAYLAALTRNAARNRLAALTAEKRGGGENALLLDELAECAAGEGSAEDAAMANALAAEINRFLRRLTPTDRDVFLRRYYYGDDPDAIALRYRLTKNGVYKRLSRTRKKLKAHLKKEGFTQ